MTVSGGKYALQVFWSKNAMLRNPANIKDITK